MRILIFGGSIVQGFHDAECGGWVSRLAAFTNKKTIESGFEYDANIFNHGISGECSTKILSRFDNESKARLDDKDGAVVFCFGINDTQYYDASGVLKTTPEQFEKNVNELIERARKYTDKIYIFGIMPIIEDMVQPMPWCVDRSHFEKDVFIFDDILKRTCEEKGVEYTYMQDVFGDDREKYLHDGIHPDTEGPWSGEGVRAGYLETRRPAPPAWPLRNRGATPQRLETANPPFQPRTLFPVCTVSDCPPRASPSDNRRLVAFEWSPGGSRGKLWNRGRNYSF